MFREYAIEPEHIAASDIDLALIYHFFGTFQCRYVAEFPKKWSRLVHAASTAGSTMERARIRELLTQLKRCAVRSGRPFDSQRPWLENAVAEHERQPFDGIFANTGTSGSSVTRSIADVSSELGQPSNQTFIPREKGALVGLLTPFAARSKRIEFIDPLLANSQRQRGLQSVLAVIKATPLADTRDWRIHSRFEPGRHGRQDSLESGQYRKLVCPTISQVLPKNVKLTVFRWAERPDGQDFHDRFFLTSIAALDLTAGFDWKSPNTDMRAISMIPSQADVVRDRFDPGNSGWKYDLHDKHEVRGS